MESSDRSYVFINLRYAESVCLCYGFRVCGQKYIIIIFIYYFAKPFGLALFAFIVLFVAAKVRLHYS